MSNILKKTNDMMQVGFVLIYSAITTAEGISSLRDQPEAIEPILVENFAEGCKAGQQVSLQFVVEQEIPPRKPITTEQFYLLSSLLLTKLQQKILELSNKEPQ
jgi:hypothetical protein